jgi:hypothetical protein
MTSFYRSLSWYASCVLSMIAVGAPSDARDYGWARYGLSDDLSQGAAYFRSHAQLRLGPERRLPNGVSWRLVTDTVSGIAMPRLTWMPDKRRLAMANQLLDRVHGAEMLVEREAWRQSEGENEFRLKAGAPPLHVSHGLLQTDVALTYAGTRLISLTASAGFQSPGTDPNELVRGLTLNLGNDSIVLVSSCNSERYGFRGYADGNFPFRYGKLLDLCDPSRYLAFVALVKEIDDLRAVRHLPPSASDRRKGCVEDPERPLVREQQEYVLYLTFSGLAVQVSGRECPAFRTPDNPIIIPYGRLEAFMLPGRWRDELLANAPK